MKLKFLLISAIGSFKYSNEIFSFIQKCNIFRKILFILSPSNIILTSSIFSEHLEEFHFNYCQTRKWLGYEILTRLQQFNAKKAKSKLYPRNVTSIFLRHHTLLFRISVCFLNSQKQSSSGVLLTNFAKFIGKHLCQSLFFNKVAGLRSATLLKKRLWHRCFPVNFAKFLRTSFFIQHFW